MSQFGNYYPNPADKAVAALYYAWLRHKSEPYCPVRNSKDFPLIKHSLSRESIATATAEREMKERYVNLVNLVHSELNKPT